MVEFLRYIEHNYSRNFSRPVKWDFTLYRVGLLSNFLHRVDCDYSRISQALSSGTVVEFLTLYRMGQ